MRYFAGIDPDMHTMPMVVVDELGQLVHVQIFEVSKKTTGRDALVEMNKQIKCVTGINQIPTVLTVEGQELYQFGASKTKNPKSIMFLATVAGMAMQCFCTSTVYMPAPQEWKGNVPKQVHQARVLTRMKLSYEKVGTQADGYCVPYLKEVLLGGTRSLPGFEHIKKGMWKHVVDAIGLTQWGREKFLEEEARVARRVQ